MKQLIITAVGPDRPGLVDELTGYIQDAGGNIADSRMVNLRGQFALIVQVEAVDESIARAISEGAAAAGKKIGLVVSVVPDEAAHPTSTEGLAFTLQTYAMDQPGIVHRITHLLHSHGVNIEELQTRLEPGSYDGAPKFAMELCMIVPGEVSIKTLRRQLEELCDSFNCSLEISPAS